MSKRKDRARAESGIIHRDGELVSKEAFYLSSKETVMAHARPLRKKRKAGV